MVELKFDLDSAAQVTPTNSEGFSDVDELSDFPTGSVIIFRRVRPLVGILFNAHHRIVGMLNIPTDS